MIVTFFKSSLLILESWISIGAPVLNKSESNVTCLTPGIAPVNARHIFDISVVLIGLSSPGASSITHSARCEPKKFASRLPGPLDDCVFIGWSPAVETM